MKTAVLILCAGNSTRMGKDKTFAEHQGEPFLAHIVKKYSGLTEKIIVITGDNNQKVVDYLKDSSCLVVENTNREYGMFSSIKTGTSMLASSFQIFIQPVDCPFVKKDFLMQMRDYDTDKQVVIPYVDFDKKRFGHPVLLKPSAINAVKQAEFSDNLKSLIKKINSTDILETDDISILHNINTPEDFKRSIHETKIV